MNNTESNIQLPFAKSHAFIIGINDYEHLSSLSTAVNDAQALAVQLGEKHGYEVHPPLLNATKAEILPLLQNDLPRLVGKDDRVFFYFAGHGIALDSDDNPKGYLVPTDAKPGEPESLISMDVIHDAITQLPCQHGLLIMDCCFAGAFRWSTGFRDVVFDLPGIIYEERFYQYTRDPAWQVITSSASDQKAMDILSDRTLGMRDLGDAKHSPFALALLDGLNGAADCIPKERGDGVITATELYTYLRNRVEDETTEGGNRQSPSMFSLNKHDKGQYIFLHPNHVLNLPPIPKRNPFMGLNSYNESDAHFFYGRDRVISALEEMIDINPFVVVSGASGTGKSSVIKAGLLPLLRKRDWQILPVLRPGKTPMTSLQNDIPSIEKQLRQKTPSLLIVDQYEELITQCLDEEERQAFESQLANWIETYPKLHIVISIRSDFEPQFEHVGLAKWWSKGRYVVPAFSQDELREVIIKPTVQEVLFFEPDALVDKLVDAVNQAPGALPLLSFSLSELYHAYINSGRTNRAFTLEDYENLGGVVGALRTRANNIYNELDIEHQDSMRKFVLRMVSLEGGELTSRRVFSEDLIFRDKAETQRIQLVAQQLVDARLISSGQDKQDRIYFEPTHDALMRAWAKLWEWIKTIGEKSVMLHYKLSHEVNDYRELVAIEPRKARRLLWDKNPFLDLLKAELNEKNHSLNAHEEDFVRKSIVRQEQTQSRVAILTIGIIIALTTLTIFAFKQKNVAARNALEAQAIGLSSKALAIFAENNTAAHNIAKASISWDNNEETKQALFKIGSNPKSRFYRIIGQHQGKINKVAFSPSGDTILSAGQDGQVVLWNQQGQVIKRLRGTGTPIYDAAFSTNGKYIIIGGSDGIASILDGKGEILQSVDQGSPITTALITNSVNGPIGVTGDSAGIVWRWNLSDFKQKMFDLKQEVTGESGPICCLTAVPEPGAIGSKNRPPTAIYLANKGRAYGVNKSFKVELDGVVLSHKQQGYGLEKYLTQIEYEPRQQTLLEVSLSGAVNVIQHYKRDGRQIIDSTQLNVTGLSSRRVSEVKFLLPRSQEKMNEDLPDILIAVDEEVIWYTINGEEKMRFSSHTGGVNTMAVSQDSRYLVTGGNDGRLLFWSIQKDLRFEAIMAPDSLFMKWSQDDLSTPNALHCLEDHLQEMPPIFYTPTLLKDCLSEDSLERWNGRTFYDSIYSLPNTDWTLRFSELGRVILSNGDMDLQEIVEPNLWGKLIGVALSKNGQFIYTLSEFPDQTEGIAFVFRKWANYWDFLEKGMIDGLNELELSRYKIESTIFSPVKIKRRFLDDIKREPLRKARLVLSNPPESNIDTSMLIDTLLIDTIENKAKQIGILTGDYVRMRKTPEILAGTDHIITRLHMGDQVEILEERMPAGETIMWYYVTYEEYAGWVRSDFIKKEIPLVDINEEIQAIPTSTTGYGISLAAFRVEQNARTKLSELKTRGVKYLSIQPITNKQGIQYTRVIVGPFEDRTTAKEQLADLKNSYSLKGVIVKVK